MTCLPGRAREYRRAKWRSHANKTERGSPYINADKIIQAWKTGCMHHYQSHARRRWLDSWFLRSVCLLKPFCPWGLGTHYFQCKVEHIMKKTRTNTRAHAAPSAAWWVKPPFNNRSSNPLHSTRYTCTSRFLAHITFVHPLMLFVLIKKSAVTSLTCRRDIG